MAGLGGRLRSGACCDRQSRVVHPPVAWSETSTDPPGRWSKSRNTSVSTLRISPITPHQVVESPHTPPPDGRIAITPREVDESHFESPREVAEYRVRAPRQMVESAHLGPPHASQMPIATNIVSSEPGPSVSVAPPRSGRIGLKHVRIK